MPELLTMLKGMRAAVRAGGSSMMMELMLIYVFSIILHMLLKDEPSLATHFKSVPLCMWTLLVRGTFMDSITPLLALITALDQSFKAAVGVIVFFLFLLVSAITVMNLLIGVTCEVVNEVSDNEREEAAIRKVKVSILAMLKQFDCDGAGQISKDELQMVMKDPAAIEVLVGLQVDLSYLKMMEEILFEKQPEVHIEEVMDVILMCRGSLPSTVKHLVKSHECTQFAIGTALQSHQGAMEIRLSKLADQMANTVQKATIMGAPCFAQSVIPGATEKQLRDCRDMARRNDSDNAQEDHPTQPLLSEQCSPAFSGIEIEG
eukprot:gnl/TRDRNA2_/TRDRNA2_139014_c1_seq1.p1 gnl/TRDRNA2_/TRDRNA2_139014_c1~~gnl/TRDRNA2_/TRDRNA2_139014_c1_seq1.p1  ORF type:complete len:318 (-),score=40.43 gnl/TRDRNA2_/TRDRNA2_139014_c1_seq1:168-1121(-)